MIVSGWNLYINVRKIQLPELEKKKIGWVYTIGITTPPFKRVISPFIGV